MVYIIHFNEKLHHAQHYVGFCEDGRLGKRMELHRKGLGAKILRAARLRGISWIISKILEGDRKTERKIKNRKNTSRLCPICQSEKKKLRL